VNIDIDIFSVRSSATVEDNENQSFAGMFKSILNVNKNDLGNAIDEVCKSISSDRVDAYIKHFNTEKPYMSIVLQSFQEPEKSGVWIGKDLNSGHLEWTDGNGEKLVSGMVKPIYENFEEGTEAKKSLMLNNTKIGDECKKLQVTLNSTADFEWCILNGELVWLQFRPVTKVFSVKEKLEIKENSDNVYYAIAASEGIVSGKPQYMEDVDESLFKEGNILLTDFTDPDWVPIILKSCGIITAEGGFLSHTAIISRELGIPGVTGIGSEVINLLKDKTEILLNGTLGKVEIVK
jgi:pyruvate,water dikinase